VAWGVFEQGVRLLFQLRLLCAQYLAAGNAAPAPQMGCWPTELLEPWLSALAGGQLPMWRSPVPG
jgi:hypothetical protein